MGVSSRFETNSGLLGAPPEKGIAAANLFGSLKTASNTPKPPSESPVM